MFPKLKIKILKNNRLSALLLVGLLLLGIDQYLKFLARARQSFTLYLIKPWLGWEYFANPGIAFSLPLPNSLLVFLSPLIIFLLILLLVKKYSPKTQLFSLGLVLIIVGAASNFIDRAVFAVTIDYIRLLTSVINLADIIIVVGALILIISEQKEKWGKTKLDNFMNK